MTDELDARLNALRAALGEQKGTTPAPKRESFLNSQVSGDHYRKLGRFQPWEVLAHWLTPEELRGFGKGTAIAYLARERHKGCDDDIRKAIHTLQLYLELAVPTTQEPEQ